MDATHDNDARFRLGGRHTPSSSRESSPATKRQKRSFTPTSDDGDLVIPVAHNEDAETPTPENVPLLRQAVGFSWTPSTSANVSTYQATVAPQPSAPCFLPGQAPPPPPKPKPSKPRQPRTKKDKQYSNQTSKFKLTGSTLPLSSAVSASTSSSSGAASSPAPFRSMISAANYTFVHTNGNTSAGHSSNHGATTDPASLVAPPRTNQTKRSSDRRVSAPLNNSVNQPGARPSPPQHAPTTHSDISQYSSTRGSFVQRPDQTFDSERAYATSDGAPVGYTNGSTTVSRDSVQGAPRSLRMVTLLIEDVRSGVTDSQLAEVRVPLKVADDPEDGFWADAVEICDALQGGPSRIDGPAKVYTMRGRFRQFFMRVDQFDQLQAQSAYLNVSKERTLSVFVEAPAPQGHLPRPPILPPDVRPARNSSPERDTVSPASPAPQPTYSLVTREDQIKRLSKSNYIRAERRKFAPMLESEPHDHSQRSTPPNARHRSSPRHDYDRYAVQSPSTSPVPGRLADTQEERDEAIANYIQSLVENHEGWMSYMQSKAKPQRVSEVLKQCAFVQDRIAELVGLKTPSRWCGAPNCSVQREHVWRVLKLDSAQGEEFEEMSTLLRYYGPNGSRYEDSRVVDMIDNTSLPRANTMDKFLRLLRSVDESFTQDVFHGQFLPAPKQG